MCRDRKKVGNHCSRESNLKEFSEDKLLESQVSLDRVDTYRFYHHFHICLTRLLGWNEFYFQDQSFVFYIRAKSMGGWGHTFHPKVKINDENIFSYCAEGYFLTF